MRTGLETYRGMNTACYGFEALAWGGLRESPGGRWIAMAAAASGRLPARWRGWWNVEWQRSEREVDEQPDITRMTQGVSLGDEASFRMLYEAYCDRLYRYLIVLTRGDEEWSRELLQVTWCKVARGMKPLGTEAALWNWLAAVARHAFIDGLRRRRRDPMVVPLFSEGAGGLEPAVAIGEEDGPLMAALEGSLGELSPEERVLVEGYYYREDTHQSLAAAVGSTPKAIESKLARVRQKLRQAMMRRLKHE